MNSPSRSLLGLLLFLAFTVMVFATSPVLAQEGSGGQGQVTGVDVPQVRGTLDKNAVVQEAPPDLQHQGAVPLGVSDPVEYEAAKKRAERGEVESTTKPVVTPHAVPRGALP